MLGKLIKHEFRATLRTMLPVLCVVLVLSLLAGLSLPLFMHTDISFVRIFLALLFASIYTGIVALVVVALVVMINRFYKNVLCEEGYLTMTLPVSTHEIIWSKLIVSFVWFFVTALVVILSLYLTVFNLFRIDIPYLFNSFPPFRETLEEFYSFSGFNGSTLPVFLLEAVGFSFLAAIVTCLHFYAAMSIGHGFKNKKILMSVVAFIGINFIFKLLSLYVISFTIPAEEAYYETRLCTELTRLVLSGMAFKAIEGFTLYFVTFFNLKKRLNLA